jgi:hypothetical protein
VLVGSLVRRSTRLVRYTIFSFRCIHDGGDSVIWIGGVPTVGEVLPSAFVVGTEDEGGGVVRWPASADQSVRTLVHEERITAYAAHVARRHR